MAALCSRSDSFTGTAPHRDSGAMPRHTVLRVVQQSTASGMKRCHSAPCFLKCSKLAQQPAVACTAHNSSRFGDASHGASTSRQAQQLQQQQLQQHTWSTSTAREGSVGEASAAPATTSGAAAAGSGRLASLSRVLLVNQPGSVFRTLANRKWPSAFGPISLLVFLFGTVMALFAAVRSALVRKVKACQCCKGFGVVRCRLCEGRGTVDWRAKFSYSEMCPLCAAKRFVVCPDCGGHYHRRLFTHNKKNGMEAFVPAPATSSVTQRAAALD